MPRGDGTESQGKDPGTGRGTIACGSVLTKLFYLSVHCKRPLMIIY